jgi:cation:H+ antiporter
MILNNINFTIYRKQLTTIYVISLKIPCESLMPMFLFPLYLSLFVVAAYAMAESTEELERVFGQGFAGGVVLGIMTALPETLLVLEASVEGIKDVALGATLGGNLILLTLGVGLVGLYHRAKWGEELRMKGDYGLDVLFLVFSTLYFLAVYLYGSLDSFTSIPFLVIYAVYLYERSLRGVKSMRDSETVPLKRKLKTTLMLSLALAILVLISGRFASSLDSLASSLGLPSLWLSLIIAPIAAELEEKLGAFLLVRKREGGGSTAVVSFIGSKIENSTLLPAIIGLTGGVQLHSATGVLLSFFLSTGIFLAFLENGRLSSLESSLLILTYAVLAVIPLYL